MKIAISGHTARLGKSFYDACIAKGHIVAGFSRSNGYDLRDYSCVTRMLEEIKGFDVFINNAKPDYSQTQILYRIVRSWNHGIIVNIGSSVIDKMPNWSDTFLLEYVTQKYALAHAVNVLSPVTSCNLILLNPSHLGDNTQDYVQEQLKILGL
jgi:hypothetical protein